MSSFLPDLTSIAAGLNRPAPITVVAPNRTSPSSTTETSRSNEATQAATSTADSRQESSLRAIESAVSQLRQNPIANREVFGTADARVLQEVTNQTRASLDAQLSRITDAAGELQAGAAQQVSSQARARLENQLGSIYQSVDIIQRQLNDATTADSVSAPIEAAFQRSQQIQEDIIRQTQAVVAGELDFLGALTNSIRTNSVIDGEGADPTIIQTVPDLVPQGTGAILDRQIAGIDGQAIAARADRQDLVRSENIQASVTREELNRIALEEQRNNERVNQATIEARRDSQELAAAAYERNQRNAEIYDKRAAEREIQSIDLEG